MFLIHLETEYLLSLKVCFPATNGKNFLASWRFCFFSSQPANHAYRYHFQLNFVPLKYTPKYGIICKVEIYKLVSLYSYLINIIYLKQLQL